MKTNLFKKCPSCKFDKCWVKAPVCEKCDFDFKLGRKPRKKVETLDDDDDVVVQTTKEEKPASIHKTCPYCKFDKCWVKAPVCEKCDYDFKTGLNKRQQVQQAKTNEIPVEKCGSGTIYVAALGRMAKPPIDFPELHWNPKAKVDDDSLLEWAESLRNEWNRQFQGEILSNFAIFHLASEMHYGPNKKECDKVLKDNADRILHLLGGDDWRW